MVSAARTTRPQLTIVKETPTDANAATVASSLRSTSRRALLPSDGGSSRGENVMSWERLSRSGEAAPNARRRTGRGHLDSYREGRVCATPGCTTRLSRYNGTLLCWTHESAAQSRR